jgi:hypothetical protein
VPVIILEGPDSSGKSTLARALAGWIGPEVCRVFKSPASREARWYSTWESHISTNILVSKKLGQVHILDRTPEISEMIYGPIVRGTSRLKNPTASLLQARDRDVITVFMNPHRLKGTHADAQGNKITNAYHEQIVGGYTILYHILVSKGAHITAHDYEATPPKWVSEFILRHLNIKLDLKPMKPQHMDRYIEEGKKAWI